MNVIYRMDGGQSGKDFIHQIMDGFGWFNGSIKASPSSLVLSVE